MRAALRVMASFAASHITTNTCVLPNPTAISLWEYLTDVFFFFHATSEVHIQTPTQRDVRRTDRL